MSTGSFGKTTPRYISLSVILYGRLCKNSVLWSAPSDMNSFCQLIVSPNVLIRSSKTGPDFSGCDMKRTTSSAYREIWWSTLPSRMGPIEGWFLILMARGSIETAKSKGLRGQSWGVPWCNQNGTDLSWFVRMEEDGWAYNTDDTPMIQIDYQIQTPPKPLPYMPIPLDRGGKFWGRSSKMFWRMET